jgi:hypothetical protein
MATTAPPSPNSKASGKANISEPVAARITIGASCQIRSRRCGRSSTSTSGCTISSGSGPSAVTPPTGSSGPSELSGAPSELSGSLTVAVQPLAVVAQSVSVSAQTIDDEVLTFERLLRLLLRRGVVLRVLCGVARAGLHHHAPSQLGLHLVDRSSMMARRRRPGRRPGRPDAMT